MALRTEGRSDGWIYGWTELGKNPRIERNAEKKQETEGPRDGGKSRPDRREEVWTDEKTQKGGRDGRQAGWT